MANNSKVTIQLGGLKAQVSKGAVPFWQDKGWSLVVPEATEGVEAPAAAVDNPSEQNSTWGAQGESTQS